MTYRMKTCIVKTCNGVEIARKRVVVPANDLNRAYNALYGEMAAQYPGNYIFCDASEGTRCTADGRPMTGPKRSQACARRRPAKRSIAL